jgi:hypothetical protein
MPLRTLVVDANLDTGAAERLGHGGLYNPGMLDRTAVPADAVRAQVERVPASTTR